MKIVSYVSIVRLSELHEAMANIKDLVENVLRAENKGCDHNDYHFITASDYIRKIKMRYRLNVCVVWDGFVFQNVVFFKDDFCVAEINAVYSD